MEYNKIKNADKIIAESKFFVKDPYKYKINGMTYLVTRILFL